MRIILIRPRFAEGYRSPALMEPLALAVLAALTPKEHDVCAIDERLDENPLDCQADLVAITVCTFSARRAYAIAAEYRKRGVPVVMGGFHPTLLPDEALEHADAVVVGDAEASWPRVLADAAAGRLERLYAPASPGPWRRFSRIAPSSPAGNICRFAWCSSAEAAREAASSVRCGPFTTAECGTGRSMRLSRN